MFQYFIPVLKHSSLKLSRIVIMKSSVKALRFSWYQYLVFWFQSEVFDLCIMHI